MYSAFPFEVQGTKIMVLPVVLVRSYFKWVHTIIDHSAGPFRCVQSWSRWKII